MGGCFDGCSNCVHKESDQKAELAHDNDEQNTSCQQELQYRTGTDLKQISIIYILGLLPHYIIFIYLHDPKSNAETEKGLSAIPDLPML